MRDKTMTKTIKATAREKAQVAADYGPMKRIGEGTPVVAAKVTPAPVADSGERGWDGNRGSRERTHRVPDKILSVS